MYDTIAEMYALKNLSGVLSGEKPRASPGVFSPATPQVFYQAYISAIIRYKGHWAVPQLNPCPSC
jgi:hypothetical protein